MVSKTGIDKNSETMVYQICKTKNFLSTFFEAVGTDQALPLVQVSKLHMSLRR